MQLNPARYEGEPKSIYELRRWNENRAVAAYLEGEVRPMHSVENSCRRNWRKIPARNGRTTHRQAKKYHLYA